MSAADVSEPKRPTDCSLCDGVCGAYAPGHNMHFIHGNHIGRTPWGWRDGTVARTNTDGWIDITYTFEGGTVRLYHHADLSAELRPGDPVRVHEQYHALAAADSWFNVFVRGGLGAVPAPPRPDTWAQEMVVGVVDLGSGRGVAADRPFEDGGGSED